MREQRIVAFLDIIGFSNYTKSASENERDRLEKILDKASEANTLGHIKKTNNWYEILPTITAISDSVIISLPLYPNIHSDTALSDNKYFVHSAAFESIFYVISNFISYFLEEGFLVRGGISCGLVKHDKNIFGTPYIEAVEAEKDFAIMPRVVLCNQLLQNLPKSEPILLSPMLRDNDGVFYINWLKTFFSRNHKSLDFNKIRGSIIRGLRCEKSQKNYAKWCWMANYFNTYVPQYLKLYHKDYSSFLPIEVLSF